MRTLVVVAMVLPMSAGLFAQNRGGFMNSGNITRNIPIPNAVTSLGFQGRVNTGRGTVRGFGRQTPVFWYGYPVYVGGFYDNYYGNSYAGYGGQPALPAQGQEQPNVTVIYPPQQTPVIINQFGPGDGQGQYATRAQPQGTYPMPPPVPQAEQPASAAEASHYLIAFKDHSIYSAVAYWVDGDTLHYFTTGSTHNQASVSLVDRELTARLNRESGVEVKLPPVK
ncbi:MAG: hypothetical protein LAQ69_02510 [Acidobacteriia bacterium]|nr:hypothetical protein [Terriglobia bacterium]